MNAVVSFLRQFVLRPLVVIPLTFVVLLLILAGWPILAAVLYYDLPLSAVTLPVWGGLVALACGYGAARVLLLHPVFDPAYRRWLATTPWSPRHPLPKGPLHLAWPDLLVVATLAGLCGALSTTSEVGSVMSTLAPVSAFTLGLSLGWTSANYLTGEKGIAHLTLAAGVLLAALPLPNEFLMLVPLAMAVLAWRGIRRGLERFPWTSATLDAKVRRAKDIAKAGWPYRHLLGEDAEFVTDWKSALIEAALVGGLVWLCASTFPQGELTEDLAGSRGFALLMVSYAALARVGYYGSAVCDHLCWGRRLATRQPVIWKHDQIIVIPVLAVLLAWFMPGWLMIGLGTSTAVGFAGTLSVTYFVLRGVGRRVETLRLEGVHSKFGRFNTKNHFEPLGT